MTVNPTGSDQAHEPGAIAFVRLPDGATWCGSIGLASLEHAVPLSADTVMNVGSVAKQITSRLVLLASNEGKLKLDTAAIDLLPRTQIEDVTVLDLIRHRGGVRDAESMLSLAAMRDLDHYTSRDLLTLAYRQRGRATPQDVFLYSNTGYLLLAEILRNVYGQPLQDIAADRIFQPLGMASAVFKADSRTVILNAAGSYSDRPDGSWISEARSVALDGPGSLWCSINDLDRWLSFLRSEWVAHPEAELPYSDLVPYLPSDHHPYLYGPGLYANAKPDDPMVFHFGHEHGFSAAVHLAHSGIEMICMSNRADLPADRLASLLLKRPDRANDEIEGAVRRVLGSRTAQIFRAADSPSSGASCEESAEADYTCVEVPGVLRLVRSGQDFHLQRRGFRDRLVQTEPPEGRTYAGPGYRLREIGAATAELPNTFLLDMDRAPGLFYRRIEPSGSSHGSSPRCPSRG
jgi:CubicO group peptidase (beta-lactamase class C family)